MGDISANDIALIEILRANAFDGASYVDLRQARRVLWQEPLPAEDRMAGLGSLINLALGGGRIDSPEIGPLADSEFSFADAMTAYGSDMDREPLNDEIVDLIKGASFDYTDHDLSPTLRRIVRDIHEATRVATHDSLIGAVTAADDVAREVTGAGGQHTYSAFTEPAGQRHAPGQARVAAR